MVLGQFVFALAQLVFRFLSLASIDNCLLSPFLVMWAGRYQPTADNPGDPEQKQTDPIQFSNAYCLLPAVFSMLFVSCLLCIGN
jgi:hypothetical protein